MLPKHCSRNILFLGIENCWEFWGITRKQVFPKEWVFDPHLLWKNVQKSKENRKITERNHLYFSYVSEELWNQRKYLISFQLHTYLLTYSKTYNFKYKIPTQKQKHFIGEHLSITKGCFGAFLTTYPPTYVRSVRYIR